MAASGMLPMTLLRSCRRRARLETLRAAAEAEERLELPAPEDGRLPPELLPEVRDDEEDLPDDRPERDCAICMYPSNSRSGKSGGQTGKFFVLPA